MESTSLEALRSRLNGLSSLLAGDSPPAVAVAVSVSPRAKLASKTNLRPPPPRPAPTAAARPATSSAVLGAANSHARDVPLGGLLMKHREAEKAWMQEKGRLNLAIKQEQQRRCRAEAEQRRVQEQLAFRLGEVKHLKEALRGRDGRIQELQDRLRELELTEGGERTAAETVRQAEAERDELRAAMHQLLARLDAANAVIGQADANMGGLEAQLAAAAAARQAAEQKAEDARAEAAQLREAVEDLQFKCGLLQQLSDLTLRQNDEKSATLRSLLESESMLDAAVGQQQQQQHGGGGMEGDGWEGNGAGDLP